MTLGISDELLASMRADVAQLLPDSCVIQQMGTVLDSAGARIETYTAVSGGTVNCRVDPIANRRAVEAAIGREVLDNERQLTVPYDAPLAINRRVDVSGGRNYEITGLNDDHSWRVCRRAVIRLVE